jgi:hypothetical protein
MDITEIQRIYALSLGERAAEVAKLRQENVGILATPLMSEGNISPMQVGMMSDRQRAKYQDSAMQKMHIEAQIRWLESPTQELANCIAAHETRERSGRIAQLTRRIKDLERIGISRKTGKMRPTYAKEIEKSQEELATLT